MKNATYNANQTETQCTRQKQTVLQYPRVLERILKDCLLDGRENQPNIAGIRGLGQTGIADGEYEQEPHAEEM